MKHGHSPSGMAPACGTVVLAAVLLMGLGVEAFGQRLDQAAGPVGRAVPPPSAMSPGPGIDVGPIWNTPPQWAEPRSGISLLYDNGQPIEDWGDPASQLSDTAAGQAWKFIAAAADDFILPTTGLPEANYRITSIRAPISCWDPVTEEVCPASPAPPSSWQGIYVTVYANSITNKPNGLPTMANPPGLTYVATQYVLAGGFSYTAAGACHRLYTIDIPVNFVLAKGVRYWLAIVPDIDGPPQTFWCLSVENKNFQAQWGGTFAAADPFWTPILGNSQNTNLCPSPPPVGTKLDLSFQIYGEELPPTVGACCNISTGTCTNVANTADCVGQFKVFHPREQCEFLSPPCAIATGACCDDNIAPPAHNCDDGVAIGSCPAGQRFTENASCPDLEPPCGTTELGACCQAGQACDDLSPTNCSIAGGVWHEGSCTGTEPFQCSPDNDRCAHVITITDGSHSFNTLGAGTDGPPISPHPSSCADVNQDVWFRYLASCDGTVAVSLCLDTNYDSSLAVYEGCHCPPSPGPQVACDNDACKPGGASQVTFTATSGMCYLIRVGGVGTATGSGTLWVGCMPAASGACCHADRSCEVLLEGQCVQAGDAFFQGLPCLLVTCPVPPVENCCVGDNNSDGTISGLDIQPFVERFLNPPAIGTTAFCQADINADFVINMADVAAFVDELLDPPPCPSPPITCCHGDTNGDGKIDGLDVQGLVDAFINQPPPGTTLFCRADVDDDGAISEADIAAFLDKLWANETCSTPPSGACCNTWFGECRIEYSPADCAWPVYEHFYPGADCGSVTCQQLTGACCDDAIGVCTDAVGVSDCLGVPNLRFGEGQTCAALDPPCAGPVLGACCDDATGTCTENVQPTACQGTNQRFGEGHTCSQLVPPCTGPITCCPGDTDGDNGLDGDDIQGLVAAILAPPASWTVEFCRADVNEDRVIDVQDAAVLVQKLIAGTPCPVR